MGNIRNILKTRIKEFFLLWKHYSATYSLYNVLWWSCFYMRPPFCCKLSTYAIKKKTAWLDKYIESRYKNIIDKYKENNSNCNNGTMNEEPCIWVFWGQGEGNMPPLVKACYRQLCSHNTNVKLITDNNLHNYIHLPEIIKKKVIRGNISWANYSDIIRNSLLCKYGGLWIDATVWVSGAIPFDKLNNVEFFSANGIIPTSARSIRFWTSFKYNWSTWCLWSKNSHNPLYSFVSEMLIAFAKKENVWPDYVIQDYLIYYASKHFPIVDVMMNEMKLCGILCDKRNALATIMNEEYNEERYQELTKDNYFFKLSFRTKWYEKTNKGKPTFYGKTQMRYR